MKEHVYIVAEAGVNHNGSVDAALRLVDAAAAAGADAVKFQTFKAESLVTKSARKADYQLHSTSCDESQFDMLKRLELSRDDHELILRHCKSRGVQFLSAAFDIESLRYLCSLDVPLIKVPSGEITNLPYLREVAKARRKVILSTGMSTMDEVSDALRALEGCDVALLHCTTEYPCPFDEVNLKAMLAMKERFGLKVGYSDHTMGYEVPLAAVAMGASIVEKHFTLDRNQPGPDHKASLEPDELRKMVESIRNVERSLGDGVKRPSPSETKNLQVARKSIVARRAIRAGEILGEENLSVKRPGTGISPMKWDLVMGTVAQKDYEEDELI